jgi:iron complex outermembrane receptor protein
MSGGRVRVLEDGIGTMDASTISADHAVSTEPLFARQVEIFRGPSTLLYGSGASGGLVNISTDRILDYVPDSPEIKALLQYDTASNGFTGAGGVSAGAGNVAAHVDGMLRDSDDYDIPGFGSVAPGAGDREGELRNSGVDTDNVSGGLSYVGEPGYIGFSIGSFNNNYGIPGSPEGDIRIDQDQMRYDLQGELDTPAPGVRKLRTRWGRNDYEHDEIEESGEIGTHFSNEEWEGRFELIHQPLGSWDGVIGLQYRNRDFAAIGEEAFIPPAHEESIAGFVLEKGDFDEVHLEFGGRYEHQDTESDDIGADVGHDLYSLSAGAGWNYADDYQLGAAITRAQRAPSIEELFANGPHLATNAFEIGSLDLGDETSTNVDLYWHKTGGRLTFSANLFYNHVSDFIYQRENDLNGDGIADRVTEDFSGDPAEIVLDDGELLLLRHVQDDAKFYGIEMESDLSLFNDDRGDLHLRVWTDYVRGKIDSGDDLPRITPWRVGAGLDYVRGPWSANLDYMRVNRQDSTARLETATPGYDSLDAYAGYTFEYSGAELTVFLRGTNLFDEEMRRHTSFLKDQAPLPGRSALLGLRGTF